MERAADRPGRRVDQHTPAGTTAGARRLLRRNGRQVLVRPVVPADKAMFADGFAGLSAESLRLRYGFAKKSLSADELRLATACDGHRQVVLVAVALDDDGNESEPVAEGRFVRLREAPVHAELAMTVVDRWQRQGVGRWLLHCLAAEAARLGVVRFVIAFQAENNGMRRLLDDQAGKAHFSHHGGSLTAVCPVAGWLSAPPGSLSG